MRSVILLPAVRPLPAGAGELRAAVRGFLAAERAAETFVPACDAWLSGWDESFSRRLAERGWVGMTIPPEYGGHGRSALDRYVVVEELLAAGAPVAAHWVSDRQVGPNLLRYGSEFLKRRYLPAIARGECYFAIGLSEPDAGSDLAAVRTTGTRVDGGWTVSGTKIWTSGAHRAHALIALLRTGPPDGRQRHVGLSQLLIELGQAVITPPTRASHGRNLAGEPRDDITSDAEMHEAAPGTAEYARRLLRLFRSLLIAGAAQRALELTVAYVTEREQFGRPLGRLPTVQAELARMAGEVALISAATQAAVADDPPPGHGASAVTAAKAQASHCAGTVAAIAHQLHGAIGTTEEHRLRLTTTRLWSWRDEDGPATECFAELGWAALRAGAGGLWPWLCGS